ncbi:MULTISPECIES: hypothetical protein [Streptomyces]|uniref:Uncharacterized protein n=1 Tax=Streptomyces lichenis TaxID=2306967 RepID=A0ABT0I3T8_9ACTN|nr:hypothetical protein [Streptomyces lichenis]MCK8675996.1 hypothetical protein [Streptomyces lichenis]
MSIDYNGRQFRKLASQDGVTAVYHQRDDLVWADFEGGPVRRGSVNGVCDPDGILRLAYTMVMDCGDVIAGRTVNTPEQGADGGLLLREEWERYGPHAETGVSYLSEVTEPEEVG